MTRTAGSWTVSFDDRHGQAVVSGPHSEVATCWHHCVVSLEREMRANARLIAAAPDLLAALAKCVDSLQAEIHKRNYSSLANGYALSERTLYADMETINAARAAIAKATEL